jgi:hypothetical protein
MALQVMPKVADLQRDRLGQAEDAVLGGDIGRLERRGDQAVGRGDVDDPPAPLLLHDRHRRRVAWKADDRLMAMIRSHWSIREVLDRGHVLDAGVVDQDVQLAELGLGGLDHVGDLVGLGHVGAVVEHLDAMLLGQFGAGPLDGVHLAQAVEDDVDALGRERVGQAWPMPLVEPVTMATCPCKPKSTAMTSRWPCALMPPNMLQCSI